MKVIFFGASRFVIPILEVLRKNYNLSLVLTTERTGSGPVIAYCKTYDIPCVAVQQFNNSTIQQLKTAHAPLAVLAYFGLILPKKILDIFPKGIINVHPSLLPKYRGPTPVQTAILNGEKTTGVTIIKLDEEVDHGPILVQKREKILTDDNSETLYERLFNLGAKLLSQTINKYIKGQIKLSPQNHSKAAFTKALTRADGYFEINHPPPPDVLDRMTQAYYPWPGVWTRLEIRSQKLVVIKLLPKQKLQVSGGKPMTIKDFINGYPEARFTIEKLFPA